MTTINPIFDGSIEMAPGSNDWPTVRDALTGNPNDTASTLNISSQKQSDGSFRINRTVLVFDTSSLTSVESASLTLKTSSVLNGDNDSNDFLVLVAAIPASETALVPGDADAFAEVELSDRVDISGLSPGQDVIFTLNAEGEAHLNFSGNTVFGIREGHDLLNDPYDGSSNSKNRVIFHSVESTNKPVLTVTESTTPPPPPPPTLDDFDIIAAGGQSNLMINSPNPNDTVPDLTLLDASDPDIYQLKQDNTVEVAVEPLDHDEPAINQDVGFVLAYAKWYKEHKLAPGRKILIVPCGVGSTGFTSNHWNPGDPLFNALVSRTNYAKALNPNNQVVRFLWQQGEKDVSLTQTQYENAALAMFAAYESAISETGLRILIGGLVPYHVNLPTFGYDTINAALANLPNLRANTAFADPQVPTILENEAGSNQQSDHYSARRARGHGAQDFNDTSTLGLAGRYGDADESLDNAPAPSELCYLVTVDCSTGESTITPTPCP